MCGQTVEDGWRRRAWRVIVAAGLVVAPLGCASPFDGREHDASMQRVIDTAIEREIASLPPEAPELRTEPGPSPVEETLAERRDELESLSPATKSNPTAFDLGTDLTGGEQDTALITLEAAITAAVDQNLSLRVARLQPAINQQDVIIAEAVFDFVLFGNVDLDFTDQPATVPVIMGIPVGTPFDSSKTYRFETGVSKRFTTGGTATLSTDLTRFRNRAPGIAFSPDPAYTAALRLGVTQPLLRGFGEDVNTAAIRIAENAESRALAELETDLLDIVEQTESAYWDLALAWLNVEVRQWLVQVGIEVRNKLDTRREFDTTLAQYADAVAVVEQRKGDVIRAQRAVREASDRLKALINDPEYSIGSEVVLEPASDLSAQPIRYDLRETILTAIAQRPEIRSAMLNIDDATIRQMVADNARLPLLDVFGEVATLGLEESGDTAYENTLDDEFIDYVIGLRFEYPIRNRAAEADFRRSRLERSQSLLGYRQTVRGVVLDLKDALRDVVANFELIQATRSFRVAQAENLRALLVEEETLAGLTPEFLNLKFQRQDGLALARLQEIEALANLDKSIAALYRAMGTSLSMRSIEIEPIDYEEVDGRYVEPALDHGADR